MLAVEMSGITKRFGDFVANEDVSLCVEEGEVHCLLGENGAGKTTLMNVLFGLYQADGGTVRVMGREVSGNSPLIAHGLGLGMVHQHFMLVDALSIWENVVVGNEPGGLAIDRPGAIAQIQELSDRYHFGLDVTDKVEGLSVGMKQRVEILKTLYRGARIIIFDEPTAVLSPPEVSQFLDIVKEMRASGTTIIFITHKLNETKAVSDHVTILRTGRSVATVKTSEVSMKELAVMMVGHEVSFERVREPRMPGEVVLELRGVRLLSQAEQTVSLEVHAGEIVGIAGVDGNGQRELEELVMGIRPCREGHILMGGTDVTSLSVRKRCENGIGYVPSDRFARAILPSFSLLDNYLLGNQFDPAYVSHGIIDGAHLQSRAQKLMEGYDVRAGSPRQNVGSLSGGNQQKMVLGREVGKDAPLVIACQPVRGLDIGAIQYIHEVLLRLRMEGKAILLISAELTDIQQLSDRIAVLYKGEVLAMRKNEEFSNEEIGLLMAGRKEGEKPC